MRRLYCNLVVNICIIRYRTFGALISGEIKIINSMSSTVVIKDFCKVILLDIEGTTTSISFVKDTLFPFVRENLSDYIDSRWDESEFQDDIEALRKQTAQDLLAKVPTVEIPSQGNIDEIKKAIVRNVFLQMDSDRKTTALKQLQGHIWREGYSSGKLTGHVFDDVPHVFSNWTSNNKKICIYSSGSVEAQKLLFEFSEYGDLLKYISDHFDTNVGAKVESGSYKNISNKLGCEPKEITFFTDIPKEAEAAEQSGMSAILVEREGNNPLLSKNFPVISTFAQVKL